MDERECMNQKEIIDALSEISGLPKYKCELVIQSLSVLAQRELTKRNSLKISGLGTFLVKKRKATRTVNPQDGSPLLVGERWLPTFVASRKLRSLIKSEES